MNWNAADLAERLGGNQQLAHELVDIFLSEYPSLLQTVRVSLASDDRPSIRRSAHAIKGTVANFVDAGPTITAFAIERAVAESRLGDVPALVEQLEREVGELAAAMRRQRGTR